MCQIEIVTERRNYFSIFPPMIRYFRFSLPIFRYFQCFRYQIFFHIFTDIPVLVFYRQLNIIFDVCCTHLVSMNDEILVRRQDNRSAGRQAYDTVVWTDIRGQDTRLNRLLDLQHTMSKRQDTQLDTHQIDRPLGRHDSCPDIYQGDRTLGRRYTRLNRLLGRKDTRSNRYQGDRTQCRTNTRPAEPQGLHDIIWLLLNNVRFQLLSAFY